jgi:hypothetical protein
MSNLFEKIGSVVVSVGLAIGGFFGYVPEPEIAYVPDTVYVDAPQEEPLGVTAVLPVAGTTYYLAGTGMSSSATSFTLTSFTITQNGKKIQDADMSETFYFTIEPGSRTRQEIVECTTVTQNANDTATISGCSRGMAPVTPYTASSTLQFAHAGGSVAVLSNPPQLYNQLAFKDNDLTITGAWLAPTPINSSGIATKGYVDSVVTGGAITLDNVSVGAIAGETFATGTIVYFDSVQQEWMKASATTSASSTATILGIAQGAGSNGNTINAGVLIKGYDETQRGGTAGQTIYLSNTAGATSTSAGVFSIPLGMYKDSTTLYFDPSSLNTFVSDSVQTKSRPLGGTGVDGALNITSGTTTLNLATQTEWNYTSVNIASGAALTFTGGTSASVTPRILVQGDFTNSGIISTVGLGAPGGSGGAVSTYDGSASGTRTGTYFVDRTIPDFGKKGYGAVGDTGGAGGAASLKNSTYFFPEIALNGSGGGGGGGGTPANVGTPGAGGAGGDGSLGLYIEVAGTYTQSGIINLNGEAGTAGSNCPGNGSNSWTSGCGGGGGGGGAGSLVVKYRDVFTYTGTTTVTGGAGGGGGSKTNTGGGGGSPVMGAAGGSGSGGATSFDSTDAGSSGGSESGPAGTQGGDGIFIFVRSI